MGWQDAPLVDESTPASPPAYTSAPEIAPASQPEVTMGQVAGQAVPKGVANFLNTPITLSNLIMLGLSNLPMAGHFPGLREAAQEPELKANGPMDALQQAGIINPAIQPQTGPQRIVDVAIQSAIASAAVPAGGVAGAARGAVVGALSGGAAQTTKEFTREYLGETGSTLLAVAVGAVAPAALSRMASSRKEIILNPKAKLTLEEAQGYGYAVEPSKVRLPTSPVEKIAGKAAIAQESVYHNQEITNKLAARSLGMPDDTIITMGVLEDIRERAGEVYKTIAKVSPRAATALDNLKQTRFESHDYWRYFARTGDPSARKTATALDRKADLYEKIIEKEARKAVEVYGVTPPPRGDLSRPQLEETVSQTKAVGFPVPSRDTGGATLNAERIGTTTAGPPDILQQYYAARAMIARTHDVERALNVADGNISAPVLGRLLDEGKPIGGELAVIGRFAQAFPRSAREVAGTPPPGVSTVDMAASAGLSLGGAVAAGHPAGAIAGGLPLLREPARHRVLSPTYQQKLLQEPAPSPSTGTIAGRMTTTGATVEENQP